MQNRHLIRIMVFFILIIIGGIGAILLLVRPHASPVVTLSEATRVVHPLPSAVSVLLTPTPSLRSDASNRLIGRWRFIHSESIDKKNGQRFVGTAAGNGYPELAFFEDGTYSSQQIVVTTRRTVTFTVRGKYVVVDSNHVRLEVVESNVTSPPTTGDKQTREVTIREFTIDGNTLTLIDAFPDKADAMEQTTTYIRE